MSKDLVAAIPADVTTDPAGNPLSAEEIEEVRRYRAQSWARVGFTEAAVVRAWIEAGVVCPEAAETARRRGFTPGDPWVPQGFGVAPAWQQWHAEPLAGPVARWRNRRAARKQWVTEQGMIADGQAKLDALASFLREDVTAGSGSGGVLSAFDFAEATSAGPDPELVAGAVDTIGVHARFLDELAARTIEDSTSRPPEEVAAGLQEHLFAGPIPSGDTVPLEKWGRTAQEWLAHEARSLVEYVRYIRGYVPRVERSLDRLSPDEVRTATAELQAAGDALASADVAWSQLSDRWSAGP